jgi:hypothetical protein
MFIRNTTDKSTRRQNPWNTHHPHGHENLRSNTLFVKRNVTGKKKLLQWQALQISCENVQFRRTHEIRCVQEMNWLCARAATVMWTRLLTFDVGTNFTSFQYETPPTLFTRRAGHWDQRTRDTGPCHAKEPLKFWATTMTLTHLLPILTSPWRHT